MSMTLFRIHGARIGPDDEIRTGMTVIHLDVRRYQGWEPYLPPDPSDAVGSRKLARQPSGIKKVDESTVTGSCRAMVLGSRKVVVGHLDP